MIRRWRPYAMILSTLAVITLVLTFPSAGVASGGTLKISPMYIPDVGGSAPCSVTSNSPFTVVCTLTVSAPTNEGKSMSWSAEDEQAAGGSGGTATFSPGSGTVKPGQTVKVKVTTHDCGFVAESWYFFGSVPSGAVAVIFGCG